MEKEENFDEDSFGESFDEGEEEKYFDDEESSEEDDDFDPLEYFTENPLKAMFLALQENNDSQQKIIELLEDIKVLAGNDNVKEDK